jgi:hypothetical protein
MKFYSLNKYSLFGLVLVVGAILATTFTPKISGNPLRVQNFPATACPGNLSDGVATAVLSNSKVKIREVPGKSKSLTMSGVSNYSVKNPILVAGDKLSSILVIRGKSGWLATSVCSIGNGDAWFAGGSGSITSRAFLDIVNSGLSVSVIDLYVFTSNGPAPLVSVTVAPNSEKRVSLDSLAPGEDSVVIHSITRSGRVSTFLFDERRKGLHSLGADFVSAGSAPSNHIVIPAISNVVVGKGKHVSQTLRIVAPGNIDASVKAKVISSDGSFAPVGLDGFSLTRGQVKDISFTPVIASETFSLILESDVPIVASVLSSGLIAGGQDFSWSSSANPLAPMAINFGGLTPTVEFFGSNISVGISWVSSSGKSANQRITGTDWATWRPKSGLNRATFSILGSGSKNVYGSVLFQSPGGLSHLLLAPGSVLESATIPLPDAGVIARR